MYSDEEDFRPFKDLDRLIKRKKIDLKSVAPPRSAPAETSTLSPRQEAELFKEAMADVTPLTFGCHWQLPKQRLTFQGFVVADTAEYMQATAPGVASEIARQLHAGRYSVQDHVDLHGLTVREADQVLHAFIKRAISEGKRAVLVVHGRGLTSPRKPVLKHKVYLWLTRGPLRKHVIALTSARSCDGGAGATYVLLRRTPMTKRMRKAAIRQSIGRQDEP
jgi:DNA-nicking Smr family endonuclease